MGLKPVDDDVTGYQRISFLFRQYLVRFAARSLSVIQGIGKFLGLGLKYGLGRPLGWIGQLIFNIFLLPSYRIYTRIKQRVRHWPMFVELEGVGHFLQRYSLYATLVAIGVLVASNNIMARTIRPDEIGQGAIWTSFVEGEISDVIVETAPAKPLTAEPTMAVGGRQVNTVTTQTPVDNSPVLAVGQERPGTTESTTAPLVRNETVKYTVVGGDTISTIAARYGLGSQTLLWANGMSENDYIKPGQVLKIPSTDGVLYTVKKGDTLKGIANKYKGDVNKILETNQLAMAEAIQPGMEIIIPNGEPPAAPVTTRRIFTGIFSGGGSTVIPPSSSAGRGKWTWPTSGHKINQYYRGRYHTGIDIEGNYSSPIYAASSGTVIFAAYNYSGYGLHVIISHSNGYTTLYGHASKVFVHVGQHVSAGQTIAMVGSTGRSTGTHLHFEIRPCNGYSCSPFLNPLAFF